MPNMMLKQFARVVLATLRGSSYGKRVARMSESLSGFSVRQDPLKGRAARTKCGMYLLASSLAAVLIGTRRVLARRGWAGEKAGLFEHPAGYSLVVQDVRTSDVLAYHDNFSAAC